MRAAPRMLALRSRGAAECRPLEFGLGHQPRAAPSRVCIRLRQADVDRPGQWQWQTVEHAAPEPVAAISFPEERMPPRFRADPVPILRVPPASVAVTARLDEL